MNKKCENVHNNTMKVIYPIIIIMGILFGMVIFILRRRFFNDSNDDFWQNYSEYINLNNEKSYIRFLVIERTKIIIILLLVTFFWGFKISSLIGMTAKSVYCGYMLMGFIKVSAIGGVFMWILWGVPQEPVYCIAIYLWGKIRHNTLYGIGTNGFDNIQMIKTGIEIVLVAGITIIGFLLEIYVNIIFLKKIFTIFQ